MLFFLLFRLTLSANGLSAFSEVNLVLPRNQGNGHPVRNPSSIRRAYYRINCDMLSMGYLIFFQGSAARTTAGRRCVKPLILLAQTESPPYCRRLGGSTPQKKISKFSVIACVFAHTRGCSSRIRGASHGSRLSQSEKRNPGLPLRVVQGSFRKNSNDSWISKGSSRPFVSSPRSSIHKSICGEERVMTEFFRNGMRCALQATCGRPPDRPSRGRRPTSPPPRRRQRRPRRRDGGRTASG